MFQEEGAFEPATVCFCNYRIVSEETWLSTDADETLTDADETLTDAERGYVIPGLTDIHFHGC